MHDKMSADNLYTNYIPAKYIIRLDDASEFMNHVKWNAFLNLIERYQIKPIIAVIPFNKDPKMVNDKPDLFFWDRVRDWQNKGYIIGMHGYKHLYTNNNSGIVGINKFSEFAGIHLEKQIEMLAKAFNKFEEESIKTEIFVAPAHSFDLNTLKALKKATNLKYISDGFFVNPIRKNGFKWIPQQLWGPEIKSKGVWTICYHPETSSNSDIVSLECFIRDQAKNIVDPISLEFNRIKLEDILFSVHMKIRNKLRLFKKSFINDMTSIFGKR